MQKTLLPKFLTLYETEDICVVLEYSEVAVVHWRRLNKLTPSSLKKLKQLQKEWGEFLPLAGYDVAYAVLPRADNVSKKLAMALGFFYIGSKDRAEIYAYRSE
jgi:hypothetical protein